MQNLIVDDGEGLIESLVTRERNEGEATLAS